MTTNMYIATLAWISLILGYLSRHDRKKHVPCMLTGIALDVGLVVYLQVKRSAVHTALAFDLGILPQLHIFSSTLALLLYFPVLYLGLRLVRDVGGKSAHKWHRRFAIPALIFRTVGFLLMFSLIKM